MYKTERGVVFHFVRAGLSEGIFFVSFETCRAVSRLFLASFALTSAYK
jgi:hypothetical protein